MGNVGYRNKVKGGWYVSKLSTKFVNAHLSRDWMEFGLCKDADPDLFFPEPGSGNGKTNVQKQREAKAICHECSVRIECLEYAIATKQEHGVWGGCSERERRRIREIRRRKGRMTGQWVKRQL